MSGCRIKTEAHHHLVRKFLQYPMKFFAFQAPSTSTKPAVGAP